MPCARGHASRFVSGLLEPFSLLCGTALDVMSRSQAGSGDSTPQDQSQQPEQDASQANATGLLQQAKSNLCRSVTPQVEALLQVRAMCCLEIVSCPGHV